MRRPLLPSILGLAAALALCAPVAHAVRPTPHQLIDQALRPIREQLAQVNATEAERRELSDVMARGEALAAQLVEAQHQGANAQVAALAHRIELLARLVRGRVEAARAESQALDAERAALDAEARRVQVRAALERTAERRLELERAPTPASGNGAPAGNQGATGHPGSGARPTTGPSLPARPPSNAAPGARDGATNSAPSGTGGGAPAAAPARASAAPSAARGGR